jgi:hypothetical protein
MLLPWYEYFQILALLVALYCWRGLKACSLLAFIPLLLIVNITEFTGNNYKFFGWHSNYIIYNLYMLCSTPFFFFLAGKMLFLTKRESLVYTIVCILCMLLVLVNFLFIQGHTRFNTYSLGLIELLMIVFSCLCLVRLTIIDHEEHNFMKEPYFWLNAMNLLFGLISLVLLGLQSYILYNHIVIANKSLYYAIMPAVNAIVYSGYSYAFILCRTQKAR